MNFKYHKFSEEQGFPLLFQHGLTASSNQISSLLGELPGVHLCGIDCPGHGKSKLGDFIPSFDNYADEVIKFMDHLELDSAIIGGLSMGSGIAINISLRYTERVKGLILHRPAWLADANPENLMILKKALPLLNKFDGAEQFKTKASFQELENILPAAATSVMGIFADNQQQHLSLVIEKMVEDSPFESIDQLDNISVPCLIIGNDDDPLHPFEMAEIIHQKIEGSSMHKVTSRYIDGNSHRNQVRHHILNFINQVKEL